MIGIVDVMGISYKMSIEKIIIIMYKTKSVLRDNI